MRAKKWLYAACMCLVLSLSACSGTDTDRMDQENPGQETGQSSKAGQAAEQTHQNQMTQEEQKVSGERVVNNGRQFVKRGSEVFFATDTVLYAYDEQTGSQRKVARLEKSEYDKGQNLYYCAGWIWYDHYDKEKQNTFVWRTNAESGEQETVCQGYVDGVSEDSRYLFISHYEGGDAALYIYEGNQFVTELKADRGQDIYYCGTAGDYVFVRSSVYEEDQPDHQIFATKLSKPDGLFLVGHIPCLNEDGSWYEYPEVTQILADGEKAYFSLSYYAGTGMFHNGGYVCEADLTKEDSLQTVSVKEIASAAAREAGMIWEEDESLTAEAWLWLQDGALRMGPGLPFSAEYSGEYDGSGILTYDENGMKKICYPGLVPPSDPETFLSEELQGVALIDGIYYFRWERLFNDPSQAIGWRPYYETVYTEFDRMDEEGTITTLAEEPGNLIMTGYVAVGAGEDFVYFQPVSPYEDYEGTPGEVVSDTYAKVYLAEDEVVSDWNEFLEVNLKNRKSLSALSDYGAGKISDAEADSAYNGYLGYNADSMDPICGQRFLLRFNRNGKIVQIAPDYAG